jgi:predicted XRE-type DNA-binding protein
VTRGDVLDDLGFSRSEATALKFKADLLDAIREEIERRNYTQRQLVSILDEHQPAVSNLMRGRINQVSIEKLLRYSDRMGCARGSKSFPRSKQWPHSISLLSSIHIQGVSRILPCSHWPTQAFPHYCASPAAATSTPPAAS